MWRAFLDLTQTLPTLQKPPLSIEEGDIKSLEKFTILLCNRTSSLEDINETWKQLFTKKGGTMYSIPPTKGAFLQHVKRAVYQEGHCWGTLFDKQQNLPCPSNWGWADSSDWKPLWTTLPQASATSRELLHCKCKKICKGRCTCADVVLPCTALCQCSGHDCI